MTKPGWREYRHPESGQARACTSVALQTIKQDKKHKELARKLKKLA